MDPTTATEHLFDPRPWVNRRASRYLQSADNESTALLELILNDHDRPLDERLTALWALCRSGTPAPTVVRKQLQTAEPRIIQAACHAVSIHRDANAREQLETLLTHRNLQVRRASAEALGRVGNPGTVVKLLHAFDQAGGDRHLEHSLLYAMIERCRDDSSTNLMQMAGTDTQLRAAMTVHDQLGRTDAFDLDRVFSSLETVNPRLRQTAAEVLSRRSDWAAESVERLSRLWSRIGGRNAITNDALVQIIAGWRNDSSIQDLLADWLESAADANEQQQLLLAAHLDEFSPAKMPKQWSAPLASWIAGADEPIRQLLAGSLAHMKMDSIDSEKLADTLVRLATQSDAADHRLCLLSALPDGRHIDDSDLEQQVISALIGDDDSLASSASNVLARIKLNESGLNRLVDNLADVAPQSLMTAIEAVHRSGNGPLEQTMLVSLSEIPAAKTLPQPFLTSLYKKSSKELREQAKRTSDDLIRAPADVQATVDKFLRRLGPGDAVRGLQVFRGNKAACSACHRMGYIGKDIGPVLTRIGATRTPAALMEAILFPSARIEQSYQSSRVLTIEGQVHNGLVRRRSGDSIELQLNAERTIAIATNEIELFEPSNVSIMPEGLSELLTIDEISDLMALLRSAK